MYFPHPLFSFTGCWLHSHFHKVQFYSDCSLSSSSSYLQKFLWVQRNRSSPWKQLLYRRIDIWLLASKVGNLKEVCCDNIYINSVPTGKHRAGGDSGYILETIQSRFFKTPSSEITLSAGQWSPERGVTQQSPKTKAEARQPNQLLPTEAGPTDRSCPYLLQPCLIPDFY